jgi:hypothetical protein
MRYYLERDGAFGANYEFWIWNARCKLNKFNVQISWCASTDINEKMIFAVVNYELQVQ